MFMGVAKGLTRRYYIADTMKTRKVGEFLRSVAPAHIHHLPHLGVVEIVKEDPLEGVVEWVE